MTLSRRDLVGGAITLGGLAATGAAQAAADAAPKTATPKSTLDLTTPLGNVTAFMKMRASVETQDVWYWYSGVIDVCAVGEPMVSLVAYDSLVLRRTVRKGPAEWHLTDWEGTYYRDAKTGEQISEVRNPVTGETVKMLNYREGPVTFRYTEQEPRIISASRDVLAKEGKPFHYPWRVVGDDIWMKKPGYIKTPHFLTPKEWPRASSGETLYVSQNSTLNASFSRVCDPAVASVDAYYAYEAASSWMPWMLMGQRPGYAVWHAFGRKVFDLSQAPTEIVSTMQRVHPQLFEKKLWDEYTSMFMAFRDQNKPM